MKFSDQLLGHQCSNDCYALLGACRLKCEDNIECLIQCDYDHNDCVDVCPCHRDCLLGCSQCQDSPYCVCYGEPTEENIRCLDEFEDEYIVCIVGCDHHDLDCVALCARLYDENVLKCPCNVGCPQGCPCPEFECSTTTDELTTTTTTTTTTTARVHHLIRSICVKHKLCNITLYIPFPRSFLL